MRTILPKIMRLYRCVQTLRGAVSLPERTLRGHYFSQYLSAYLLSSPLLLYAVPPELYGLALQARAVHRFGGYGRNRLLLPVLCFGPLSANKRIYIATRSCVCYAVSFQSSPPFSFGCLRVILSYSCKSQSSISIPSQPSSSIGWFLHLYASLNALSSY